MAQIRAVHTNSVYLPETGEIVTMIVDGEGRVWVAAGGKVTLVKLPDDPEGGL